MMILRTHSLRFIARPNVRHHLRLMSTQQFEHILTSRPATGVALITLNRPRSLNALSTALFTELNKAVAEFDADDEIGALVLTGSEKAFAGMS